jgi:hypothetical protein
LRHGSYMLDVVRVVRVRNELVSDAAEPGSDW